MADIATVMVKDPATGRTWLDWVMQPPIDPTDPDSTSGDLVTDDGLQTAVYLSLFTDRRARDDDGLPAGADRRGWWGDVPADGSDRPPKETELLGSRLWLLTGRKQTKDTAVLAKGYVLEALRWMLVDGVAQSVTAELAWLRNGTLGIAVKIAQTRPGSPQPVILSYAYAWAATMVQAFDPGQMAVQLAQLGTEGGDILGTESGNPLA